jgi:hypothetical protein
MIRRAGLVLGPAFALALVSLLLSAAPTPASAFPTNPMYDRSLAAPGAGPFAVGDLNGDGLTDIVTVDQGTPSFHVFLQTPSGLPSNPTATQGTAARELLIRDIDGNGERDLVALGPSLTSIYQQVSGNFGPPTQVPTGPGNAVDAADLNGDGAQDLAILLSGGVQVWFQNTTGGWPTAPSVDVAAPGFHDLAAADLVGDGLADLVLVKPYELRVFPQTPGGLDRDGVPQDLEGHDNATMTLVVASVGGDTRPDVVFTEANGTSGYGRLSVYAQEAGSFTLAARVAGGFTGPVVVGDLNDDGVADVAAAVHDRVTGKHTVAVFLQGFMGGLGPDPSFQLSVDPGGVPSAIGIGRFSGRPFNDLVARTPGAVLVYEQEDHPPVLIRAIPSDIAFNAGSSGAGLIDLRNYFADDHGVLRFEVYEVGPMPPGPLVGILAADGYHVDFTATTGWFGRASFWVSATDGVPGHLPVSSNTFSVIVNALPRFTSAPPGEVRPGERFLYQATVSDPFPAEDAHTFSLVEAPAGMTIDGMTGLVDWTPSASDAGTHPVRIRVSDTYGGQEEQAFTLRVVVAPAPLPTATIVAATTLGLLALLGASSVVSENVKYGLLMIFIPMYSKIKREQVLDHFVRGQIYGYVLANPGEHYNAIKVALSLTNGSLAHHLKTLEREHFVKSKRFGLYRRFYPMSMKIPEDGFFTPNEIQKTIVDLIRATPGITQKEIAERLGLTPPTVNYHVGILSEHRAIRVERAGRKTHCFVVEPGTAAPTSPPSGGPPSPGPSAPRPPQ